MSRPTTFGVPSIIGTAESLAPTMSWSHIHLLGRDTLPCNQSSTTTWSVVILTTLSGLYLENNYNLSHLYFTDYIDEFIIRNVKIR